MDHSLPPGIPPHGPDIGEDPGAARAAAAAQMRVAAAGLAEGFRQVIPGVVELQVRTIVRAWGRLGPEERRRVEEAAREAGRRAGRELAEAWEREAALPLEEQRHGPLQFLRSLWPYATRVLADAGVPPVRRDAFSVDRFPGDVYGVMVERFIDLPGGVGGELQALHLAWGVGKAMWVKAEQAVRSASRSRDGDPA